MAEKGFGVKEINLIGASGTPTIESPNNLNLNAVNVAISTNVSIGGTLSVTGNISVGGTLTYEDVTNIDSVGIVTARDHINIVTDNKKLQLGAGQDLELFHSGSHSFILNNTGNLVISNMDPDEDNEIHLRARQNEQSIVCKNDGAVELYYNGNDKLATSNTGVTVSGTLVATTFSGSGASLTNLPAANLTGTLPAISGANLTGIAVTEAPVVDYTISGSSAYNFHGGGVNETANNPDLFLVRGQKYRFNNTTGSSHPFKIRVYADASGGTNYTDGVTGDDEGVQFFTVPYTAPAKIYYQCSIHLNMRGNIYIRGAMGQNDFVGITTFIGEITSNETINLASTKKLSMASDVFKIYHATNGYIINESGDLVINNTVNNKDIKISTGASASETVRITHDGRMKVGFINNVDPTTVFDVMASAVNQDIVRFTGANYNRGLLISTAANGGVNDCDIIYDAVSTASKGKHTFKTDGTTRLHIDENGYLIKAAGRACAFNVRGSSNMSRTDTNGYICQFNDDTSTGCFDSGNNFNTSTYKFIAPVTGTYYFFTNIRLDAYSTGYIRTAFLSTNYGTGASYWNIPETGHVIDYYHTPNNILHISTSTVVQLDKDDELYVWQDPSADNSYTVYLTESSFGGYLIG